ncbi:cAMP-binding domain of CRP or a regulatory subunit of cAMP-dependent protein kinases [Chryseobacterium arachidis]|uniref:cAMP-binding domain of CRP or a regulatory subunit of cAMP-dependent protein kinases n=1 Tax=Chryseobacterium arachidis TaxID=1416778 RepID=A0A1M4V4Z4_9FLAO|nr:Crp/Fnr family transcriptional regulator [Chryseobacterium arachidis]SHE64015.1 cAMP-binding domain of CRP or a regulatory subunit of cAMP-dependent protein kinases [Chryseobacterium arachidis]
MIQTLLESGIFSEKRILKRNEYLNTAGSIDTQIYYIENGSMRIFIMDEDEERIIRIGYSGNIVVSLDSFLSEKPSEFYIQAIKTTEIRLASKKDFYQFIQSDDENMKFWTVILEDLVLQQIEREKDLLMNSPKERFERVLKRSPKLFQEIPNKYIANYLRMSPETLSRLKKS